MKSKYLFVVNPVSGTQEDRESILSTVKQSLSNVELSITETTGENDISMVREYLEKEDWKAILAGGGDGTIRMIAKATGKTDIPVGIIPMGSANGLAKCLETETVAQALEAIKKEKTKHLDILHINNDICLHLSDFGFNAGLVKKFEDEDERGMIAYFKSTLKQFREMKPYRFSITINGKTEETTARLLVIANADKYGTGAIINPVGKIDDGILEIISINPDGFEEMASLSFDLFQGTLDESEYVKIWTAKEAHITNPDGADFQIDGEVMETPEKIDVYCKPNQIRFFSNV